MKLKIIGTSNGIIDGGYAWWLERTSDVEIVANLSIGVSLPCLVPVALERDESSIPADVIILDLCVNEQRSFGMGLHNPALSEMIFEYFIEKCCERSERPLILLIPTCVDGKLNRTTSKAWRKMCTERNVPFLDVGDMVDYTQPAPWKDNYHPTREFSEKISERLTKLARGLIRSPAPARTSLSRKAIDFRIVRPNAGHPIERSSRLITKSFQSLEAGESFELSLPDGGDFELVGISHNAAKTHAALKLDGDNSLVQRLDSSNFSFEKNILFVVWAMPVPVRSKDGRVSVEILEPSNASDYIKIDHPRLHEIKSDDPRPVSAELDAFVVRPLGMYDKQLAPRGEGVNVSIGKPATQSSALRGTHLSDAKRAVSGKRTGGFSFHTEREMNPWWVVDLEQRFPIEEVLIFNRLDMVRQRAYSFILEIASDDGDFRQVHTQSGRPFGGIDGNPARIKLNGQVARYVRIELPNEEHLHLDAVEIYARPET